MTKKNPWPFYKRRHWGPERGWDLTKVTQPQNLKVQVIQSGYRVSGSELGAAGAVEGVGVGDQKCSHGVESLAPKRTGMSKNHGGLTGLGHVS